ncbi:MAG: hypothetical protein JWP91_3290 [Fibrobacteres bacterium]|nr:hypothetical protein [Fibrobacterota bacterium]
MVRNDTKPLRTAAGIALFLALILSAVTAWALIGSRGAGDAGMRIQTVLAEALALALLLCVLWLFLLVRGLADGRSAAEPKPTAAPAPAIQPAAPPKPIHTASEPGSEALMLLSLLQEKGRFVDFVMDDIAAYTNEQVGAAARVVHQGCREVIIEAFAPLPVAPIENARMTLEPGYDAGEFRLVGRVSASPPFTVKVTHKGWRARHVKLPRSIKADKIPENPIIVPAEVAA